MKNKAMKRKPRGYWNEENVRLEANSYINQTAFRLKAAGAYYAAKDFGILDELFPHKYVHTRCRNKCTEALIKPSHPTNFQQLIPTN